MMPVAARKMTNTTGPDAEYRSGDRRSTEIDGVEFVALRSQVFLLGCKCCVLCCALGVVYWVTSPGGAGTR